jgi:hypothetical protein
VARKPVRPDDLAPGDAIEAALRELAARLEAHEVIEAAAAAQRLGDAVNTASSGDIDEVTRARLAPLYERCTALAARSNAKLAAVLVSLGTGNRAHRAYRSVE